MTDAEEYNSDDEDIAQTIANVIGGLDRFVFPETPIGKISVITGRPESEGQRIGYTSPKQAESGVEYYVIFLYGLDKAIDKINKIVQGGIIATERRKHLWELTPSEHLIGLAAHEVRHRVQYHLPIALFSPEILGDIDNPHIRELIKFVSLLWEKHPSEGDYHLEFDAICAELLAIETWHRGEKDFSKIASIVKSGAKEISWVPKPIPTKS